MYLHYSAEILILIRYTSKFSNSFKLSMMIYTTELIASLTEHGRSSFMVKGFQESNLSNHFVVKFSVDPGMICYSFEKFGYVETLTVVQGRQPHFRDFFGIINLKCWLVQGCLWTHFFRPCMVLVIVPMSFLLPSPLHHYFYAMSDLVFLLISFSQWVPVKDLSRDIWRRLQ